MKSNLFIRKQNGIISLAIVLFVCQFSYGQSTFQLEMQKLHFMVGDWVGTASTIENGEIIATVPAFEKISYKLDGSLLTIDLHSEKLQLHTVIYYDEEEQTYFYNPFYKNGSAKYKAKYQEGKFIVAPSKTKRFVFSLNEAGEFVEYGETLKNGKWLKYFEDTFKNIR
ncbi:hypothetical protein [Eudoraea chungangensis]|uniref:hypothetical protein n=1 Tax=Eudoraea chungangensis TaxID=1481905 RepID=UPI0023EADADE|nr:hypothetical protein [Eudoraea chungangensis]